MLAWECPTGYNPNWYGACEPDDRSVSERIIASGAVTPLVGLQRQESCEAGYTLSQVDGQCHADSTQDAPRTVWGGDWRTSLEFASPTGTSPVATTPSVAVFRSDGSVAQIPASHLATVAPGPVAAGPQGCDSESRFDPSTGRCAPVYGRINPPPCTWYRSFNPSAGTCEIKSTVKLAAVAIVVLAIYSIF